MTDSNEVVLSDPEALEPAPREVADFAETCVRYVTTAMGISLDFTLETLPLLDHYLQDSKKAASRRPETIHLLAFVAGSYIGEVIRRRHACRWNTQDPDASVWTLIFRDVALTIRPILFVQEALMGEELAAEVPAIEMDSLDRDLIIQKLEDLPFVSEEDFFAPSTRVEVVDIIVDALRSHRNKDKLPTAFSSKEEPLLEDAQSTAETIESDYVGAPTRQY